MRSPEVNAATMTPAASTPAPNQRALCHVILAYVGGRGVGVGGPNLPYF